VSSPSGRAVRHGSGSYLFFLNLMFSLRILSRKVLGFIASSFAAPPGPLILPAVLSRTRLICSTSGGFTAGRICDTEYREQMLTKYQENLAARHPALKTNVNPEIIEHSRLWHNNC
jgi:hypothetical protein